MRLGSWRAWALAAAHAAVGAATFLPWQGEWQAVFGAAGAFALYNRLERDGQLENGTRKRIFDHVRERPGQSIAQIASRVGVSHSTASYHLERLLEFNLIASTPDGNKMRFFVNGGTYTEEDRRVLSALSHPETRRVLAAILTHPGSYRAELSALLGVSSPTVNWHLARLLGPGLVTEEQRGRNRYLFASPASLRARLAPLAEKVAQTAYDASGLRELLRLCG